MADQQIFDRVAEIGRLRAPVEACGLILPLPWRRKDGTEQWVIELPNRSLRPNSFVIKGEDIGLALREWAAQHIDHPEVENVGVWHTHPNGGIGPSREDMRERPAQVPMLVVALHEDGTHTPTWY